MIYHKVKLDDATVIKAELYEDEIFADCPYCGKEHQIEPEQLAAMLTNGEDFAGTTFWCTGHLEKQKLKESWYKFNRPRR